MVKHVVRAEFNLLSFPGFLKVLFREETRGKNLFHHSGKRDIFDIVLFAPVLKIPAVDDSSTRITGDHRKQQCCTFADGIGEARFHALLNELHEEWLMSR